MNNLQIPAETAQHTPTARLMKQLETTDQGLSADEFKQFLHGLTAKVMTATGAAWVVVRIVDPCSGRTIKEYTDRGRGSAAPSATIGNRAIIEGRLADGVRTFVVRRKHPDLLTVCIPDRHAGKEDRLQEHNAENDDHVLAQ